MNQPYDVESAWERFAKNGRVEDYLHYRSVQQKASLNSQEDESNAAEYRWPGHQNTEYRGS